MKRKVYILENLGCANCASKIESKIAKLPGVEEATITFATKQLRLKAKEPEQLLTQITAIAHELEPDIIIRERDSRPHSHSHGHGQEHHSHGESCGCGHTPEHEHVHHSHDHDCGCGHVHEHEHVHHSHDHNCGCGHSHEHEHSAEKKMKTGSNFHRLSENTISLLELGMGAVLFLTGEILSHQNMELTALLVFIAGYLLLGGRILLTALKNLKNGQVFDENFLMSLATLGAFAIREYPEAVGVMLFYRIGEYFEHVAVEKSRSQIMAAVDLRPEVVQISVGDQTKTIPAQEARKGDILIVRPGDRIPLDGVITQGETQIDTSPVTGEPVPVKAGCKDEVISGCVNVSGLIKIRVEKVLEESMVTRILDSVENAAASKPKIDRFITRFARIYTPFVVILAVATAVIPSLITGDWSKWVYTALTFLVISCPCALVLSVPLAFFSGIGAGSKKGILFKGGVSLEAMRNVSAVVMDKTGTITQGNFVLQSVHAEKNVSEDSLLALCAGCEQNSTHPIAGSIVTAAKEKKLEVPHPEWIEEIAGHGIRAKVQEGEFLCGNQKLMDKYQIDLSGYQSGKYGTEVLAALNGRFLGYLVISDTIKKEAPSAIEKIKELGIVTAMLTGDAPNSANAVAQSIGIDQVHAKLLPEEKLEELRKIRSQHGPVMFVGDGINDAPVLAGADVGAAMGSGADAAIEAADVVFMTSSMEAIPQSLSIARSTSRISWQNVVFALVVKGLVMLLGLAGFASMWMAVFADTGVAMICVLNSIRILYKK